MAVNFSNFSPQNSISILQVFYAGFTETLEMDLTTCFLQPLVKTVNYLEITCKISFLLFVLNYL